MKIRTILLPVLMCLFAFSASGAGNEKIKSFSEAKKHAVKIHLEEPYTIYCHCRYSEKTVDLNSCGYKPRRKSKRSSSLEWEHVVPAESFGQSFKEWRVGTSACMKKGKRFKGRKCAVKNKDFALMEADLYNLWPEVGELNGLRSNYSMAALGGAAKFPASKSFGGCKAVVADRKFEPMDKAKGIVARTYMYMEQAYPGHGIVSEKNRKLYEAWDKMFPVTDWECKRAVKISEIQGNENPILKERCGKKAG